MAQKPKPAPKPRGRTSTFTEAVAAKIVQQLSEGVPLAVICRAPDMPCVTTVWNWQRDLTQFAEAIARAREAGFDVIAAECLDIAEDGSRDYIPGAEGEPDRFNAEHVQRSKLRIDTRLKLLAKWDPKRYGDSVNLKHSDPDGDRLVVEIVKFGAAA